MKKISITAAILLSIILIAGSVAAAPVPQQPNVTFTLVQGLPDIMQVGESYTVVVEVTSDVPFNSGLMLPDSYYPGHRFVQPSRGDHSRGGTSTTLSMNFVAVGSTAEIPGGAAPVAVVAAVRFQGGYTVYQRYDFLVTVP